MERAEDTWEELGHEIRARNDIVFVRTDPIRRITEGGIILTDKQADFYYGLPGKDPKRGWNTPITKWATVIAAGPKAEVAVGDRVCFMRLDFAWSYKLRDGTLVGWARNEVLMLVDTPEDGTYETLPEGLKSLRASDPAPPPKPTRDSRRASLW